MIDEYFKKYPFIYDYFSALICAVKECKRDFPQAIIFEGENIKEQYYLSLELARSINCSSNDTQCGCTNCKWIKSYSHPAIQNVSQIHFKGEDDETKTAISVKQARKIESSLNFSSDYHRFFIFFSSKEGEGSSLLGYKNPDFSIEALDSKIFNSACANTLLKSIEEPPKNTTFVFLTKSKSNILPTIVSRCQTFKLSGGSYSIDYGEIIDMVKPYPDNISYEDAFEISSKILGFESISTEVFLNKFIAYIKDLILKNPSCYTKLNSDIRHISNTIKHIKANVSEKAAVEALFLKIAGNNK